MLSETLLQATAKKNVETIAQVEQQLLRQRSPMERSGEGCILLTIQPETFYKHKEETCTLLLENGTWPSGRTASTNQRKSGNC